MYNKKRIIIIAVIATALLAIIAVVITLVTSSQKIGEGRENTVIIDNARSYQGDLSPNVFISIGDLAYGTTVKNLEDDPAVTYNGIIRDDTFERGEAVVSFILDIPSIKMSWKVAQGFNKDREITSSPSITCIDSSEAIYPIIKNCGDSSNYFQTPEQESFLAMTKILPLAGPNYQAYWEATAENDLGYKIIATVYGEAGKDELAAAFTSLGFTITDYPTDYIQK